MKLAAIDIGSNAIRLQITSTIRTKGQLNFKKLEYVRFPLRLGQDVFNTGSISPKVISQFIKLMQAYKLLIDLYEVDDYMACATSAMREAKNGNEVAEQVLKDCGIDIKIIDGAKEAFLINNAIDSFIDDDHNYVHIDVGGGSTEITLIVSGKKVISKSFKIGSVRRLENHDSPDIWNKMKEWVIEQTLNAKSDMIAVGTGGNINKLFELSNKLKGDILKLEQLKETQQMIRETSIEDRINELQMNPDRADVIVPASEIYISVMEWASAKQILVPDVGLKDGIMRYLYRKHTKDEKIIFVN